MNWADYVLERDRLRYEAEMLWSRQLVKITAIVVADVLAAIFEVMTLWK
jgi:hypothetical protein